MKRNIDLRLGCRVVDVEESGHILAVILASGERVEADLVVGADGKLSTDTLDPTKLTCSTSRR